MKQKNPEFPAPKQELFLHDNPHHYGPGQVLTSPIEAKRQEIERRPGRADGCFFGTSPIEMKRQELERRPGWEWLNSNGGRQELEWLFFRHTLGPFTKVLLQIVAFRPSSDTANLIKEGLYCKDFLQAKIFDKQRREYLSKVA